MPRLVNAVPAYCHDRTSDRAFIRLDGRRFNLGRYNSPESRAEYERLLGLWMANHRRLPAIAATPATPDPALATATPGPAAIAPAAPATTPTAFAGILCGELALQYIAHADRTYVKNGEPTGEAQTVRQAMRYWCELFAALPVRDFGPKAFKLVREHMKNSKDLARTTLNKYASRVKAAVAWAVGEELIPGEVYHRLQAVKGIRKGSPDVRESEPVEPVDMGLVNAVLPLVSRQVGAMIRLQLLTGMRPGEVCAMRAGDIDMTVDDNPDPSQRVWKYTPGSHKTEHHGVTREIPLGPKAQEIITPFLTGDPSRHLFRPVDAERERNEAKRARRGTPMTPSAQARRRRQSPAGAAGECYDENSYRLAIHRACDRAFPLPAALAPNTVNLPKPSRASLMGKWGAEKFKAHHAAVLAHFGQHRWSPNQLRHNRATELEELYDITAAQRVLGHQKPDTTRLYSKLRFEKAAEIMRAVG